MVQLPLEKEPLKILFSEITEVVEPREDGSIVFSFPLFEFVNLYAHKLRISFYLY